MICKERVSRHWILAVLTALFMAMVVIWGLTYSQRSLSDDWNSVETVESDDAAVTQPVPPDAPSEVTEEAPPPPVYYDDVSTDQSDDSY